MLQVRLSHLFCGFFSVFGCFCGLYVTGVVFADDGLEFFAEEPAGLVAYFFLWVEKDGLAAPYADKVFVHGFMSPCAQVTQAMADYTGRNQGRFAAGATGSYSKTNTTGPQEKSARNLTLARSSAIVGLPRARIPHCQPTPGSCTTP